MRPPPAPIDWEFEKVRDAPLVASITIGCVGICLAIIGIVLLFT